MGSSWKRNGFAATFVVILLTALTLVGSGVASAKTTGPYFIKFKGSGKCVDVPNHATANGTEIDQWTCLDQANEMFYLDYVTSTSFRVRNYSSGRCLNFKDASTKPGTSVILYTCGAYDNEIFTNLYIPTYNWSVLTGKGNFGLVQIPDDWNGFGFVPSPKNGAKLIEGKDTAVENNLNAAIVWCKTLTSCSAKP